MLNSVGPTWEGNQVWFITAGGATFAAWPLVYATGFSGFYVALIVTLFALFLRPVGFRLPKQDPRSAVAQRVGLGDLRQRPGALARVRRRVRQSAAGRTVPVRRRPARFLHGNVPRAAEPVRARCRDRERRHVDDARRPLPPAAHRRNGEGARDPRRPSRRRRAPRRVRRRGLLDCDGRRRLPDRLDAACGFGVPALGEDGRAPARGLAAQLFEAPVDRRRTARRRGRDDPRADRVGALARRRRFRAVVPSRSRRSC